MKTIRKVIAVLILGTVAFLLIKFLVSSYVYYEEFRDFVNTLVVGFALVIAVIWAIVTLQHSPSAGEKND